MIVPGPDLVAARFLPGEPDFALAGRVHLRDPSWAAPIGWRTYFRDALAAQVRSGALEPEEAKALEEDVARALGGRDMATPGRPVLQLMLASGRTAAECEFAWLARTLTVSLVTGEPALLAAFPELAVHPADFLARGRREGL